jgi:DNA polymerase elongation subunit (family B)
MQNADNDKNFVFQALDWDYYHTEDDEDRKSFVIQIFGQTKEQKKVYLEVTNYEPFFFIEVSSIWSNRILETLVDEIKKNMKARKEDEDGMVTWENASDGLISAKPVEKYKFWGFTNYKKFKFLQLNFRDFDTMKICERACKRYYKLPMVKRLIKLELFESNIIPILRFMHIRQLEAMGWISIPKNKLDTNTDLKSCCDINYSVKWTNVDHQEDYSISKFTIMAFDIECTSGDGSFPQPERDSDKVIQIGATLSKYGEDDVYEKHLLSLGETADIEGVHVQWFDTEQELLVAFTKLLRKINPEIITGYNIFGFDFTYLKKRADYLAQQMDNASGKRFINNFTKMSRIITEKSEWKEAKLASSALGENILRYFKMTGRVIIDLMKTIQANPAWKLSSYKLDYVAANFIRESITSLTRDQMRTSKDSVDTIKPLDIDKLSSDQEKNKKMSKIEKEKEKKKIEQLKSNLQKDKEYWKIDTKSTFGLQKGNFVTICYNDGVLEEKYDNGAKFPIIEFGKNHIIIEGTIDPSEFLNKGYKVFWTQAKDDITPNDIFTKFKGTPEDRAVVGKYCIMDCILCNKLMAKLQIVTNNIGMANVCHVPLNYLFLRGQGVKIFSLVAKKCREFNHLIPVIKKKFKDDKDKDKDKNNKSQKDKDKKKVKNTDELDDKALNNFTRDLTYKNYDPEVSDDEEDDGYEGAIVFEPDPGVYFEPIPVLDYASLYPNSMILRNLSHETLVMDDKTYGNVPGYRYHKIQYKKNSGQWVTCKFAEKIEKNGEEKIKGIIPKILIYLLTTRKKYKKLMNEATDPFRYFIYDGLQQAYKVTANSLYGQTGAGTSPICMKEIAASTTATGREMLKYSKYFVEAIYSKLINLALTDKTAFFEKMNEEFMYFPTEMDIIDIDGEKRTIHVNTDENDTIPDSKFIRKGIGYEKKYEFPRDIKIWGNVLKEILALEQSDKITFKEMLYTSVYKNISEEKIYDKFKNIWKQLKIENSIQLKNDLISKIMKMKNDHKIEFFDHLTIILEIKGWFKILDKLNSMPPFERTKFRKEMEGCIFSKKGYTVKRLYEKFNSVWNEVEITNSKQLDNEVMEVIENFSETTQNTFIDNLETTIDEMGYNNKQEMFEKFYETMHNLLDGYSIDAKIIYGDSVTGDTPLLMRKNNKEIYIDTIDNLGKTWEYDELSGKYMDCNIDYEVWTETGWTKINKVIKHKTNKKIYEVITNSGYVKVTEDHSLLDVNGNRISPNDCQASDNFDKTGTNLLHSFPTFSDEDIKLPKSFPNEIVTKFSDINNLKRKKDQCGSITTNSQLEALQYYYLFKSNDYNTYFMYQDGDFSNAVDKKNKGVFEVHYRKFQFYKARGCKISKNQIVGIMHIPYKKEQWVYDLETENHHFHAGVGEMIVHNTDSVFFCPHIKDNETGELLKNDQSLRISIIMGIWGSILITTLCPPPMAQEYEKVLWPFIIQGKKRYVGNLYEKDPTSFKQKCMGIELKRRDNAPIVKIVSKGIIDKILNERDPEGAYDFTREILKKIITGQFPIDKFIITKTLKGNGLTKDERILESRKPKEKRTYAERTRIVHAVLADRMADRDPGNRPLSNERIPYAYIETKIKPILQGDRVETPEYINKNNLKIDYLFYVTNQIMKPAKRFLDLITNNAGALFKDYIFREENRKNGVMPMTYYTDKNGNNHDFDQFLDDKKISSKDKLVLKKPSKVAKKKKNSGIKNNSSKIISGSSGFVNF